MQLGCAPQGQRDLQELLHQFVTVISFVACVRLFEGENSEKDRFECRCVIFF